MTVYLAEYHDNRNDVDCSQDHCEVLGVYLSREGAVTAIRREQKATPAGRDFNLALLEGDDGWFDGCDHFYAIYDREVGP